MKRFHAEFKDISTDSPVVTISVDFIADDVEDAIAFCDDFINRNTDWQLEADSIYELA